MLAVIMSFVQPDMTFTPGSFAGTGLQYLDVYYSTVQSEIATLKAKGGTCLGCTTATYRWEAFSGAVPGRRHYCPGCRWRRELHQLVCGAP